MKTSSQNVRLKYAIYGALFGCLFPIVATIVDLIVQGAGFSLASIVEVQQNQPLHWVIDSAPIFLGFFSCLAGIKQQEVIDANAGLEKKVDERTEMLNKQNEHLRTVQEELELNIDRISHSINYAQRIQKALISNTEELRNAFPDSFVMFRPRDVVSGDFPWYLKKGDHHFLAAVDCTGHGVPGAFMSLIGYFLLNKIVKQQNIDDTGDILCALHKEVVNVLNQQSSSEVHDGMDMAICRIDPTRSEVQYSGAGNPVYHISKGEFKEYKADFWSIGGTQYKKRCPYKSRFFNYEKGDVISMFSDGITDQFSDDGSTKFGYKPIKKHLLEGTDSKLADVQLSFEKEMDEWKGNYRQMDDMLLMAVRL